MYPPLWEAWPASMSRGLNGNGPHPNNVFFSYAAWCLEGCVFTVPPDVVQADACGKNAIVTPSRRPQDPCGSQAPWGAWPLMPLQEIRWIPSGWLAPLLASVMGGGTAIAGEAKQGKNSGVERAP